jgi:tetratricopeptide (TPR) repeat protein
MEGNARMALGEYIAAEALYRRAYELKRARLSGRHANLAYSLYNIARAERARGDYPAALRDVQDCLQILTATLGPADAMLARAHAEIGHARKHLRDPAGAIAEYRVALAIFEAGEGQGGEEAAVVRVDLGRLLASAGQLAEARVQFARAEPALRGVQGENRDYDLLALAGLVACDAADRRVDRARLGALEDAVAVRRALSAEAIGFTAFARARAWAALGDRRAARALAATARAAFVQAGIGDRSDVPMRSLAAGRW